MMTPEKLEDWDDKSGNNANYMFFGDFSTLDFNGLNYFIDYFI